MIIMRLIVQDCGDPDVGIWSDEISMDLEGMYIEDIEERKQIEEGFRKFLKDYDLVQQIGESHWEME